MYTSDRIQRLILDQLTQRESRLLSLIVSLRCVLTREAPSFKGDLGQAVAVALRKLINAGQVLDQDGTYCIFPAK